MRTGSLRGGPTVSTGLGGLSNTAPSSPRRSHSTLAAPGIWSFRGTLGELEEPCPTLAPGQSPTPFFLQRKGPICMQSHPRTGLGSLCSQFHRPCCLEPLSPGGHPRAVVTISVALCTGISLHLESIASPKRGCLSAPARSTAPSKTSTLLLRCSHSCCPAVCRLAAADPTHIRPFRQL